MSAPKTREDLDVAAANGCQNPECDRKDHELFLHGRCHPGAPVMMRYAGRSGVINTYCAVCMTPIVDIAVADVVKGTETLH